MAKGPNASNRNFKVFKDISIPQGEYLIEVWGAKDFNKDNPKVALLSVGSEKGKGNKSTKETSELLESSNMNFVGNIEGDDISEGKANVVVCDGFTGNILLKSIEGLGKIITEFISKESKSDQLKRQMAIGICYNWRNSVNFLADYSFSENESKWNFGSEIWFYDIFAARLGMHDEKLTSGFGLKTNYWIFDVAVMAHQKLGSTYLISIGLLLGEKS